jgi:hypothetical protein
MNKTGYSRMATTVCGILAVLWSCGQVAHADFTYGAATPIPNVSRPGAGSPQISRDGLELYFSYKGENQCPGIWVAKRSTTREPWGSPVRLDPPVNSAGPACSPCISADGLELYFGDGHPETYLGTGCVANPNGYGGGDLWVSTRAKRTDPWGNPQNLGPAVNTVSYEDHPSLSADGLSLYFTSDRSGPNQYTLWMTTRPAKNAAWGWPVKIGAPVDISWTFETTPFIAPDGLSLYFSGGSYTPDIYVSKRATTAVPWGKPVLFTPVNSPGAEWYFSFSEEDSTLYFERADNFYGVVDLWQVEVTPIVDFNEDGKVDEGDLLVMTEHWGENYPRCDIGPMGWGDGVVNEKDLKVLVESLMTPGPRASDVSREVILGWGTPSFDMAYDVYFGTSPEAVSTASRVSPQGVLVSKAQAATTYDPPGLLEFNRTYYWRVDFVIPGPTPTIYQGPVLSFTTEAFAYPVTGVTAKASSSQRDTYPQKTADGSGLDGNDAHSTTDADMWLSDVAGPQPTWIRYEFDKTYTLHEMWVWNYNAEVNAAFALGFKSVSVQYSTDGSDWTTLGDMEFAAASGQAGDRHNTTVSFGGVPARYVKLTAKSNWSSRGVKQYGLSEVRFFYIPDRSAPKP